MPTLRHTAACLALLLAACGGHEASPDGPREDEPLAIGQVQGRDPVSPMLGREVVVEGIVTGNFVAGLGGFFLQDALGADDGDPKTSDAIFVERSREDQPRLRRGDRVLVRGRVVELGREPASLTALTEARVEVRGRGQAATIELDAAPANAADWERFEGMQIAIEAPLTVSGNGGLLRFGELVASFDGRLYQSTELAAPGDAARRIEADNLRRQLILDDARNREYPSELWYLSEPLSPATPLRAGSVLHGVRGVLDQRHGQYRLQLTEAIGRIEQAPRPPPPEPPPGLRIVGLNLLNLFNGDGRGGGFPTSRGAADIAELERQRAKLVQTLAALQGDVVSLMELENDGFDPRSSLLRLVEELNAALGVEGDYRAVDIGQGPGQDEIRVGLIYRAGRMQAVGAPQTIETGSFAERNRPPVLQGFRAASGGPAFAVVAVHLKSKGGCAEAEGADRDQGDGQGCWNESRRQAAAELSAWALSDPAGIGNQNVVIVGDYNAYAQEDPIRQLRAAGWRDAPEGANTATPPHSFVWQGRAGRLDHGFVSPALAPFLSGVRKWHSNADESEAFDYARQRRQPDWFQPDPYRASDHDPLILGLDFSRRAGS
jgi:uncharacterized protein